MGGVGQLGSLLVQTVALQKCDTFFVYLVCVKTLSHHVALVGQELSMHPRMASNSPAPNSRVLGLLARITMPNPLLHFLK